MRDEEFPLRRRFPLRIHSDGWRFVAAFGVVALLLFLLWAPLGWLGLVLTAWCVFFFRDPERVTPTRPGLIVSPADGVIQAITEVEPPPELGMGETRFVRVSIFMDLFNVHVNRAPASGRVTKRVYSPGKFFNASLDKASIFNERLALRLSLEDGRELAVVQIAGLIARRIRCDVIEGQILRAGQRFGLIRFGSRLDVYLPLPARPLVAVGQTAIAGETVLADLESGESSRRGERR